MSIEKRGIISRINAGEFVKSVQIDPPSSASVDELYSDIQKLVGSGVKVVDVNASRRVCYDSIQLAASLSSHFALEVIPHITARDNSVNGLVNQIFAAYSLNGINNFLIVTGDRYNDSSLNGHQEFPGVFQKDSIGILREIDTKLRNSSLALNLTLAASVNQNAHDSEKEGERVVAKEDAGADLFMSQPVFTKEQVESTCRFYREYTDKPLVLGVWPLMYKKTIHALYDGKVEGVMLPAQIHKRALEQEDERLHVWGIDQTAELIRFIQESNTAQGIYIVAPLRNPGQLVNLVKTINKW